MAPTVYTTFSPIPGNQAKIGTFVCSFFPRGANRGRIVKILERFRLFESPSLPATVGAHHPNAELIRGVLGSLGAGLPGASLSNVERA